MRNGVLREGKVSPHATQPTICTTVGSENNSPSLVDEDDDRGGDGSSVFGKYYKLPRETAADSGKGSS